MKGKESISLHFDATTTKSFLILFFRRGRPNEKRVKKKYTERLYGKEIIIIVNDKQEAKGGWKKGKKRSKNYRNTRNDSVCCVIMGRNERERKRGRERERKVMYLLATDSVIPVQTCVWPIRRLAR